MSTTSIDNDIGNSPWYFPVHIHWHCCKWAMTPANVTAVAYLTWQELGGWDSWVRITTYRPLPIPPGHMGHVFLGEDLSWRPHESGRPLSGFAGGDLRYQPPVQDWMVACFVDDRYNDTLAGLAKTIAHEVEHLLGRLPSHPPFPIEQRRAGARMATSRSRGLNVPLPNKVPRDIQQV